MRSISAMAAALALAWVGPSTALPVTEAASERAFDPHAPLIEPAPDPTAPFDLSLPSLFAEGRLLSSEPLAIEIHNITYTVTGEVSAIPLPPAAALFVLGLAALGLVARRWIVA